MPIVVLLLGPMLEARTWTSTDGRTLEGELVEYDPESGKVRIRRADGREFTLPKDRFSAEDGEFLAKHQAEIQAKLDAAKARAGVVERHMTSGEHKASFHVYFPKSYEGRGKLPMLILFSAAGRGEELLRKFIEPADELEWILVGCDRLKNRMPEKEADAIFSEMLPAIEEAVPHDPELLYLGGISGGALRAYDFSGRFDRPWKGIVACGGWLGGEGKRQDDYRPKMAVAIVNGDNDKAANSWVASDTEVLKRHKCRVKLFHFPGGHEVGPPDTLLEAMKWIVENQRDS